AAEVTDDDPFGLELRHYRLHGDPVEAVPADSPIFPPVPRDRVGRRLVRHRRMEGGVEDGDVWRVGQRRTSGLDRLQRRLIVERSEWTQLLDRSNHVAVDQRRLDEA